ncbi:MAG TPA: hypothetical protein DDW52_13940 [Planctomycetaceae bacterium]|nr:hypothetical protein [Planctomycetaceae bacterium]
MLRLGCVILTIWVVLNLIPAAYIVVTTAWMGVDSPAVGQILDPQEQKLLTAKERISINSVAVYANGLNIALSTTVLSLVWFGAYRHVRWAYWSACVGLTLAVVAGSLGDYVVGTVHPEVSWISAIILFSGALLSGLGMRHPNE